jgi:hypothetical protein
VTLAAHPSPAPQGDFFDSCDLYELRHVADPRLAGARNGAWNTLNLPRSGGSGKFRPLG